ncbi:hypothetical protein PC115_g14337 [Phytophthora cactorum]|uniref:Uncharacterized protein n=1 Tax=Phytophthora cactorum TaxID=29920 RepID=A0A8T1BPK0_9STRA|nr:hypothetical protein PC115_g14337 [Phytophthora cactorum]
MARAPGTPDIPEKTWQAIVFYLAERSVNGYIKRGGDRKLQVSRDVYTKMLFERDFPAIRAIGPDNKRRTIFVQQDNVGPHVIENCPVVAEAGTEEAWKLQMRCQPARSPRYERS